jgi:hypothetical protein
MRFPLLGECSEVFLFGVKGGVFTDADLQFRWRSQAISSFLA